MRNLRLYTVDKQYIKYLQQFEENVLYGDGEKYQTERKYLGVILEINEFKYFAPLSSPKQSDYFYENGKRFIRRNIIPLIRLVSSKNILLGKVKLNNMIPVPDECLTLYDVENEPDEKYRSLVQDEIICIRKQKAQIMKNANILYNQKTKQYAGINYLNSTVDFKRAEKLCREFEK